MRLVQERINYLIISTFAMLAKRPESVSLNWSLQSREKRAIKIIIQLLKTNLKKERNLFCSFKLRNRKIYLFPGRNPLLQKRKEAEVCRPRDNVHFRRLGTYGNLGSEGSGVDKKGRRNGC